MLSAANTHDSMLFEPLLDTDPTVRGHHGRAGRPRCRPDKLHADKGYDYPPLPPLPDPPRYQGPYRPARD